jgi:hypothetical protein
VRPQSKVFDQGWNRVVSLCDLWDGAILEVLEDTSRTTLVKASDEKNESDD